MGRGLVLPHQSLRSQEGVGYQPASSISFQKELGDLAPMLWLLAEGFRPQLAYRPARPTLYVYRRATSCAMIKSPDTRITRCIR